MLDLQSLVAEQVGPVRERPGAIPGGSAARGGRHPDPRRPPAVGCDGWIGAEAFPTASPRPSAGGAQIKRYLRDPSQGLPMHAGVFVVLLAVFWAARRSVRRQGDAGDHEPRDLMAFDRPWAAALVVALLFASSPLSAVPSVLRSLFVVLALVPKCPAWRAGLLLTAASSLVDLEHGSGAQASASSAAATAAAAARRRPHSGGGGPRRPGRAPCGRRRGRPPALQLPGGGDPPRPRLHHGAGGGRRGLHASGTAGGRGRAGQRRAGGVALRGHESGDGPAGLHAPSLARPAAPDGAAQPRFPGATGHPRDDLDGGRWLGGSGLWPMSVSCSRPSRRAVRSCPPSWAAAPSPSRWATCWSSCSPSGWRTCSPL